MNGKVRIQDWYRNDSYPQVKPVVYEPKQIDAFLKAVHQRKKNYYGETDKWLYQAYDKYRHHVENKKVGIIGSTIPWYESIVIGYGGHPTTVEYNKLVSKDPRLAVMTVEEYNKNPIQFDSVLCISSYEHDGLGRYGDPINPNGDLQAMEKTKGMLKQDGLLFLSVPIGIDSVVWNVHRVYGKLRLPLLLKGWEVVDSFGYSEALLEKEGSYRWIEPVFVLRPKKETATQ